VTNYHVAVKGGNSVVRVNCLDGPPQIFPFDPSDWTFIPNGDDVAVIRLPVNPEKHQINAVPLSEFVFPERFSYGYVGTGEDVFMVGRFVDHDGGEINQPAVRFGHISIMPTSIYLEEIGRKKEYYCIDLHSRSGFSGSPVFVYRTITSDLSVCPVIRAQETRRTRPPLKSHRASVADRHRSTAGGARL
jgi:hypothetical protein